MLFRSFGVVNAAGVSAIFMSNVSGGMEVDHLQYGLAAAAVPEPSNIAMLAIGLIGAGGYAMRRRKGADRSR